MTRLPVQLLMILLAALSAFTLPEAKSSVREAVQGIFVPVTLPAQALGRWLDRKMRPPQQGDAYSPTAARSIEQVRAQNAELIAQVLNLEAQLEDLRRISAMATNVRDMVQPARVIAGPANGRQTLTINTTGLLPLKEGMPVVHPQGFAGQIYNVGAAATARVLLATDPQSRLGAQFVRLSAKPSGQVAWRPISTPPFIAEGDGGGIVVHYLPARAVRNIIAAGDTVVLTDAKFPGVKNFRLGTVRAVELPSTDSGHAVIRIDPVAELGKMQEVLVVDK